MIVLVCGGRDFKNAQAINDVLDSLRPRPSVIITGGCKTGADYLASSWGHMTGCVVANFGANWSRYGRAAGPMRNQAMLDVCRIDLVVAFPGSKGTEDMVRRARRAGVPIHGGVPGKVPQATVLMQQTDLDQVPINYDWQSWEPE